MTFTGFMCFFQCWCIPSTFPTTHSLIEHGVLANLSRLFRQPSIFLSLIFCTCWAWVMALSRGYVSLILIMLTHWCSWCTLVGIWSNEDSAVKARQWNPRACEGVFRWHQVQEPAREDQRICSLGVAVRWASLLRNPCPLFVHASTWPSRLSVSFFYYWRFMLTIYFRYQMAFYVPSSSSW